MKSAVETLNPTRVKLTVEVTYDELKPSMDAAYKTIAGQVSIPGFRKGKVPPRIIDQRVGREAVLQEAVSEALPHFYLRAVEETDVRPLGRPTVDVTDVPDPKDGGDLKFTAEVDVRPQIALPDPSTITVTVDSAQVTDEDVEERLTDLRARFGTLVPADRPAADGDFVSLDISATIDGDEVDAVKGVSYEVGSGNMIDGMDAALPGMSAGDTTTFETVLAGERAGQSAQVTVTVQSVKERELPELNDDFASEASEFDTLAELREDLRTKVTEVKQYQQRMQAREKLLAVLLETVEIPLPEAVISEEVERHLEAEDRAADDEHRAEVTTETTQSLRNQLLLDAVVESEQIEVTQPEILEYLVLSARQYGMEPQEFVQLVERSGQISSMVAEVGRSKALATLAHRVTVVDTDGVAVAMPGPVQEEEQPTPEQLVAQAVAAADAAPAVPAPAPAPLADPAALPSFDLPVKD